MSRTSPEPHDHTHLTQVPSGTVLGSFTSYEQAQAMVDALADADFPVAGVSIVGRDLASVEQVMQKLTYPRVALSAASSGLTFGLLIGVGFALFIPERGWGSVLPMMLIGAALWMIFGVISYALQRGRRDFLSRTMTLASRYEVICDPDTAAQARQILGIATMSLGHGAVPQAPERSELRAQHTDSSASSSALNQESRPGESPQGTDTP